jgi:septal ring factor EnvC (AmiA/AmiB activator)
MPSSQQHSVDNACAHATDVFLCAPLYPFLQIWRSKFQRAQAERKALAVTAGIIHHVAFDKIQQLQEQLATSNSKLATATNKLGSAHNKLGSAHRTIKQLNKERINSDELFAETLGATQAKLDKANDNISKLASEKEASCCCWQMQVCDSCCMLQADVCIASGGKQSQSQSMASTQLAYIICPAVATPYPC